MPGGIQVKFTANWHNNINGEIRYVSPAVLDKLRTGNAPIEVLSGEVKQAPPEPKVSPSEVMQTLADEAKDKPKTTRRKKS